MIISFQTWTLVAEEGFQFVKLTFLEFKLEDHSSCSYDYVEICQNYYYEEICQKICGTRSSGEIYTSITNTMTVKMKTDNIITKKGFKARWTSTNIGATQTTIQYENYQTGTGETFNFF